ncbi:MAG: hypothetical protein ACRDPM_13360, partial [Solirubrobacteraceae bacterium]
MGEQNYEERSGEWPEEWIYLGRRIGSAGKVVFAWRTPDGEGYYTKRFVSGASIGGVYGFTVTDKSLFTSGPKAPRYLRRADVPPDVSSGVRAEWFGKDTAAGSERERKSTITTASREHPQEDLLAPLRKASMSMTRNERRELAC